MQVADVRVGHVVSIVMSIVNDFEIQIRCTVYDVFRTHIDGLDRSSTDSQCM